MRNFSFGRWLQRTPAPRRRPQGFAYLTAQEELESRRLLSATGVPLKQEQYVQWYNQDTSFYEGNADSTTYMLTIIASPPAKKTIKIHGEITTSGEGAGFADGSDFGIATFDVEIKKGQSSVQVPLTINGDTDIEPNEIFVARILSATGAMVYNPNETLTILNDDYPISPGLGVRLQDTYYLVLDEGESTDVTVELVGGTSELPVTVSLALAPGLLAYGADGPAAVPGDVQFDNQLGTIDVVIPAGQTSVTFSVLAVDDQQAEVDEGFALSITGAVNATPVDTVMASGVILDDDGPPEVSIAGFAGVQEGNSGQTPVNIQVYLDHAAEEDITVTYATVVAKKKDLGGHHAPAKKKDFVIEQGTVTILAGETQATIQAKVIGDTDREDEEIFFVDLKSASAGAKLSDYQDRAFVEIFDDDGSSAAAPRKVKHGKHK